MRLYKILISVILFFILLGAYKQLQKQDAKAKRLSCQREVVTFERVYYKDKIELVKKLLKELNYNLSVKTEKAKYMKSQLFKYVKANKVGQIVKKEIEKYSSNRVVNSNNKLQINLLIYENDKLDPGKKTKKSKLYAGYLLFDFLIDNRLIYKVQIDFMDLKGKDIKKRVSCAIKSVFSL